VAAVSGKDARFEGSLRYAPQIWCGHITTIMFPGT